MEITTEDEQLLERSRMTIWEHLEVLRKRLIISLIAIGVALPVCWHFRESLFNIVQAPFPKYVPAGDKLSFISLTEPFSVYMKLAAVAALIFPSPIIIHNCGYSFLRVSTKENGVMRFR